MKHARILSLLMALALVFAMLPATVLAAETVASGTCGADGDNLTWVLDSEGTFTVSGEGDMEDFAVVICPWEAYCDQITTVVLEPGVASIGEFAFNRCSGLKSVTIPEGVTRIGYKAFGSCASLTSIVIPAGVEEIGQHIFDKCTGLTSVSIPAGLKKIGFMAFAECTNLTDISIPASVTEIGGAAFSHCTSLTNISIPAGVKKIENSTFYGCTSLTDVTIPDGVVSIGGYAFGACSSLTSIYIPASVTTIGDGVFYNCSSLQYVHFAGDAPEMEIGAEFTQVFTGVAEDFCIFYDAGTQGWTTPEWNGVPCFVWPEGRYEDVPADKYYTIPVQWASENGITTGTVPGFFAPYEPCTRAQVVTFLWRAAGCPEPASTVISFPDVPAEKYYTKAILWAAENGITNGRPDGTFCPYDTVTRAEFVTFLWRAQGKPTATGETAFQDVPADKYYTEAIAWAAENGITTGIAEGVFGTYEPCTRAHVVTFLYRACGE